MLTFCRASNVRVDVRTLLKPNLSVVGDNSVSPWAKLVSVECPDLRCDDKRDK